MRDSVKRFRERAQLFPKNKRERLASARKIQNGRPSKKHPFLAVALRENRAEQRLRAASVPADRTEQN